MQTRLHQTFTAVAIHFRKHDLICDLCSVSGMYMYIMW